MGNPAHGFTPAYAGNTQVPAPNAGIKGVHPRIRGEYPPHRDCLRQSLGSPPHTRGIRSNKHDYNRRQGFTPAYAGNTLPSCHISPSGRVHPRIRGEYFLSTFTSTTRGGSPPHTRGIPMTAPRQTRCRGFTPAYAGNTHDSPSANAMQRVHPRIRGEYCLCSGLFSRTLGSPPHTRGIPSIRRRNFERLRFTPAYAGNTDQRSRKQVHQQVHPRIRGEYRATALHRLPVSGSPPHTRGIQALPNAVVAVTRFTPAYAGNTA